MLSLAAILDVVVGGHFRCCRCSDVCGIYFDLASEHRLMPHQLIALGRQFTAFITRGGTNSSHVLHGGRVCDKVFHVGPGSRCGPTPTTV